MLDKAIYDSIQDSEMEKLQESLETLISAGFIECNENNEVYISSESLERILIGCAILNEARNIQGQDDNGFVMFPFVESHGN